ncbi:MAG: amino acid permease [Flavipsychrobacter sp.]|jgi:APA family basic amino acid/polyamine antiporter|nr:amino acid permease [Flavipsychrobacter sp.]
MSELKRNLSLATAISLVVGGVIGSGIFMKPALMASQLGSPLLLLSVWVVAGIITLFGALSNAEVAAMMPETGGQYVFFKKMYGNCFAFLYGWAAFAVFNTAGNASIAYVCAQYADYFIALPRLSHDVELGYVMHIPFIGRFYPVENLGVKSVTIGIIVLLTVINYFSVRYGAALQRFLTMLKVVAIALLISGLLFSGKGNWANATTSLPSMPQGFALLSAYMAAIAGAFWAYDGWNNITFISGEIKEPQKNIPKSLLTGLSFCMLVYLLIILAFVYILPIEKITGSSYVAANAAAAAWGIAGGGIIAAMVILSTFGAANANVLATSRVTYALGKENSFFAMVGTTQPRFHTPGNALVVNACWSIVLILTGSFDTLTDMLIFVSWFFYGMSALGLFILRYKMKDAERPYKVPGYPVVPLVFILFTAFFLIVTLYTDITNYNNGKANSINSLLGIAITCVGLVFYFFRKK